MIVHDKKYSTLLYYQDNRVDEFPRTGGIYYWVYFPDIDPNIPAEKFISELHKYSTVRLSLPEKFKKTKFKGEINEVWFESDEKTLFGLSKRKTLTLTDYLLTSIENRRDFLRFIKHLSFSRPFYIGMASDLRTRLRSHLNGHGSTILSSIEELGIKKNYIWVGYSDFNMDIPSDLISTHEEIYQRFLKPGLTKKFG